MKFSLSSLKERFHSPLIHDQSYTPNIIQPKIIIEKVVANPVNIETIPEAIKKEDSMISPIYCETHLAQFKPQNQQSSIVLKMGFCCERPITKLLATNHTTQLFDCCKDQCPRKIIKVSIGSWS
jgi:hypothetical protein